MEAPAARWSVDASLSLSRTAWGGSLSGSCTLQQSGYSDRLGGGVVITGGGANLRGLAELAERVLHLPVRRGVPHNLAQERGVGPESAVAIGLCQYARHHADDVGVTFRRHRHVDGETTGFFKISRRLKEIFSASHQG